uniref:SJCHGC06990 protein n=1 Tax=Schistosoma japonicum TaxID=6182 RepID=Q5DCX6_SCHJA|nr:SJCHGC06990 protein [Schistosoma japonicum]
MFAYHILGFATGYFIHDIYHNLCSSVGLRSFEIILHHITVFDLVLPRIPALGNLGLVWHYFGLLMGLKKLFFAMPKKIYGIWLNIQPLDHLTYPGVMACNKYLGHIIKIFGYFPTLGGWGGICRIF